jgi:LysR family hydrogen peroxide-inducible transcriptional activator
MITLIQLEYIVAVDTWRHFATAAEKCFITQPTLSMQIKKLEEDLGILIFDRSKQPVIPTQAGEQIILQARQTLKEAQKIYEIVKTEQGKIGGELKLAIIPTLAPYLLPRFVGNFINTYPNVQLHVQELLTDQILDALKKDQIDAGLLVTPIHNNDITIKPLFYEKFVLYAKNLNLPEKTSFFNIQNLKNTKFWILASGHCFRNQTLNICNQEEFNKQQTFQFESGSLETLTKIVDIEGGATLVPELAALDMTDEQKKQLLQFGEKPVFREVSLVYSRKFVKAKVLNLIEATILNSVPKHMLEKGNKVIVELE